VCDEESHTDSDALRSDPLPQLRDTDSRRRYRHDQGHDDPRESVVEHRPTLKIIPITPAKSAPGSKMTEASLQDAAEAPDNGRVKAGQRAA